MGTQTNTLHSIASLILLSVLGGCDPSPKIPNDLSAAATKPMISEPRRAIDPMATILSTPWKAANADTSQWYLRVDFHDEYLTYWYHGQCVYSYFTQSKSDTIQMLWTWKKDCLLDMDFLERYNGSTDRPTSGEVFADYCIENDSTVRVRYAFPEWIATINKMERDSIFPQFLHRYQALHP